MNKNARRVVLSGTGAIAVVVAVASLAWACTLFAGKFTVSGNGTGSAQQSVYGDRTGMDWCNATFPADSATDASKLAAWSVRTATGSPTITLKLGTGTHASCSSVPNPSDGDYTVKIKAGYMGPGGTPNENCHGSAGGTIVDSAYTVTNGAGPTNSYSTALATGWNSVCVYAADEIDAGALNFKNI